MKIDAFRRMGRRALIALVTLLLVGGAARGGQVVWDSYYFGERDPYLQALSPEGVTLRWQTQDDERGVVRLGTEPGRLTLEVREPEAESEHEVRVTGLLPDTRYYYTVGSEKELFRGGSPDYSFVTPPPSGTRRPVRIWAMGDSGYPSEGAAGMRDSMLKWTAAHPRAGRPPLDVWLALGDIAYDSGRNSEFQKALFDFYPSLLRSMSVWPVYGNHDSRRPAYFRVFSPPQNGEAGGNPSGTKHYYSFDFANVHFVVLDSEGSDRSADGPMMKWLRKDLLFNRQPWLIAAFHHPPYTRGTHNSDDDTDSDGRMGEMRRNALPLLEAAGVDLVFSGHSHMYERSHLLDCHYGLAESYKSEMALYSGKAGAVFYKPSSGLAPHEGTVYVVAGSASKVDQGPLDHPANVVNITDFGSVVVDIDGTRLEARFINSRGEILDSFAIVKGAGESYRRKSLCS